MQKRGLFLLAFVLGAVPVNAGLGRRGPAIPSVPKKAGASQKQKQQPKQLPKQKQKQQPQKQKPVPPKKTNEGRFGKSQNDAKSGHKKRTAGNKSGGVVVATNESLWVSKVYHTYQSVKDFLLTSSGPEEPPYLLVGIRYLVVAMFFCLAALAIIDSFSKVPSVFGDTILVVPRY